MTIDNPALVQSVPKQPEPDGLYLMDGIAGLLALPRHSVDMILTDPPYGPRIWNLGNEPTSFG